MSIPLDNLYAFINHLAEQTRGDVVDLRRFYPHGSKDINDLSAINNLHTSQLLISPLLFCYDQEPLDFDRYQNVEPDGVSDKYKAIFKKCNLENYNFQFGRQNIYDKSLLIHSEKNSVELEKYRNNWFIPVYYWSHAIISLDWFRYAKHVKQQKQVDKPFLMYNRAWSGTREYRLRFVDLLINSNLQEYCRTSFNPIEPELGVHYQAHQFKNSIWQPTIILENYFPLNTAPSHYSATVDLTDYEATDIEVVLETLFDDNRLQLTEKSLRPIACGQPFILVATPGSLEYLKSYGFKTYSNCWPETYDHVQNPIERMREITALLKQISNWDPETRVNKLKQAQDIAEYNRQHFFSENFSNQVINELKDNLATGLEELENTNTSKLWLERRKKLRTLPEFQEAWNWPGRTRQDILKIVARARYYYNKKTHQGGF